MLETAAQRNLGRHHLQIDPHAAAHAQPGLCYGEQHAAHGCGESVRGKAATAVLITKKQCRLVRGKLCCSLATVAARQTAQFAIYSH